MIGCIFCGADTDVFSTRGEYRRRRCQADASHVFGTVEVVIGNRLTDPRADKPTPIGPSQRKIIEQLEVEPLTATELSRETGLGRSRIVDGLAGLRRRKLVYVCGYRMRMAAGGRHAPIYAPIYALGDQADAPRPSRDPTADKRYRVSKANKALGPWAGLITNPGAQP